MKGNSKVKVENLSRCPHRQLDTECIHTVSVCVHKETINANNRVETES